MDFVRDPAGKALINTNDTGYEKYKMQRARAKKVLSLEDRLSRLEQLVDKLMQEREAS